MAVFKCKMCGGNLDIIEGSSICVCQYCATKQTVPLFDSDKKETLFLRANRLRFNCEFDKAYSIYNDIIAEFPEEAEAYWGLVLCKYGIEYVDDPKNAKKIPTCHRSSFDSVMDDENFDKVCEFATINAREIYRNEAKQIEELRRGIIAISSSQEPYDIFICYKETDRNGERTTDSVIAQDVYEALTKRGYRVFFARISLEDKLGKEYEPYIFSALHSAKIMLVFGTDYEHFNAVWVKNEWSRFLKLMEGDSEKTLIPCFKGIDAYDMPKEFTHLQAQDMGKVGAMQDLLRGIEKILTEPKEENIVIQAPVNDEKNVSALLKRANTFLQCNDYSKADQYYDKILDISPNNEEALIGKLLLELHIDSLEEAKKQLILFHKAKSYKYLLICCTAETKAKVNGVLNEIKELLLIEAQNKIKNKLFKQVNDICDKILDFDPKNEAALLYKLLFAFSCTSIEDLASETRVFEYSSEYDRLVKICSEDLKATLVNASKKVRENLDNEIKHALSRKMFKYANSLCSEVLKYDSQNENALIARVLSYNGVRNLNELELKNEDFSESSHYYQLLKYCSPETKKSFENCLANIRSNIEKKRKKSIRQMRIALLVMVAIFAIVFTIYTIYAQTPKYIWGLEECDDGWKITTLNKEKQIKYGHLEIPSEIDGKPVVRIEDYAFQNCSFSSVTIPNSVSYIGEGAFSGCKSLTSIEIPDSISSVSDRLFSGCTRLTSVEVPNSVTLIGESAFEGCISLRSITLPFVGNGSDKTYFGYIFGSPSYQRNANYVPTNLKTVTITGGTSIGDHAFYACSSLTSIKIPRSVTNIGRGAFWDCSKLTSIVIPSSVTSIGQYAFEGCSRLTSIVIPRSVTSIREYVFRGCSSLTIYCEATSEPIGWDRYWNYTYRPVQWGYNKDDNN